VPPPNLRAVPDQPPPADDRPQAIHPVNADGDQAADQTTEMLRSYIEERIRLGRQAVVNNTEGSVQWLWGHVLIEELSTILNTIDDMR